VTKVVGVFVRFRALQLVYAQVYRSGNIISTSPLRRRVTVLVALGFSGADLKLVIVAVSCC
jgi:hypothetical protein